MGQQISKAAARRMWRALQPLHGQGGFLLFDRYGNGGAWYTENSRPAMGPTDIRLECHAYGNLTIDELQEDVQRWLDDREADREAAAMDNAAALITDAIYEKAAQYERDHEADNIYNK